MSNYKNGQIALETGRLVLRQWKLSDYKPFAALNADPEVMRYFPSPLTEAESNALAFKLETIIARKGWGFWAVELRAEQRFIGFVGLNTPADLPFSPCVEIGWRLARDTWGKGYASEAARASLDFAFDTLDLEEVVAFTPVQNRRSRTVMQRLGMTDSGQNFEHPFVPDGCEYREHVLYRISRPQWRTGGRLQFRNADSLTA